MNYNAWIQLYHPEHSLKHLSVADHQPLFSSTPIVESLTGAPDNLIPDTVSDSPLVEPRSVLSRRGKCSGSQTKLYLNSVKSCTV